MSTVNLVVTLPVVAMWIISVAFLLVALTEIAKLAMQWFAFMTQRRAMLAMQKMQGQGSDQRVQPATLNIPLRRR